MSEWDRFDEPAARLNGFVSGFHATFYVYTGVECGLFRALTVPRSPAELASSLSLHRPYVRRFCEAGLRWGLLAVEGGVDDTTNRDAVDGDAEVDAVDGDAEQDAAGGGDAPRFRLREGFAPALADPEDARYVGDLFQFLGEHLTEDYVDYPAAFESGERRPLAGRGSEYAEVIEGTTRGLQVIFVAKLLSDLEAFEARLERGGRLLDVGCGAGSLACRLCQRYPDVEVVGVDLDRNAIERARDRAAREGLSERTTFLVQDARTVDGRFDAAVLFLTLHEIDRAARAELFDNLGEAFGEGGVVAVFDDVYPETPDEFDRSPYADGVETQWSELLWGTAVATRGEQRDLLSRAGCEERSRMTFAEQFEVYEGVKQ